MLRLNVPYLRPADLDHAVRKLLHGYAAWKKAEVVPPIDVDEIVEGYLGLTLEVVDLKVRLDLRDALGATWLDEGCIRIDEALEGQEGRFAFTVAHEIGHWQLHRPHYEMSKLAVPLFALEAGQAPTAAVVCRATERKVPAEWQADQFAARLLMPAAAVRTAALVVCKGQLPVWDGLAANRKAGTLDRRLYALAVEVLDVGNFANVSKEAMSYRLLDLHLVKDSAEATLELF